MTQQNKKKYVPPKLVRIKLDAEQAILGACSTTAGSSQSNGGNRGCRGSTPLCRRFNRAGDSAISS